MLSAWRSLPARRLAGGALSALLAAVAFLLGCYELGDTDVWWHLRGGEWILENGRAPGLDPFTFGSAERPWVDVHWSYEVVLALAYRAGGAGALVLLGAAVGAAAFLAALTARRREWPAAVAALCWLPALVLFAFRLDPRPEIFSLLYIGIYLAVLFRSDTRPALAWWLVPVQVLWVNAQGLFILGPVLLGLFVAAHAARLLWERVNGRLDWGPEPRRWWRHVGGACAGVAVACLVNPYFLDGALFPFDLFPKVARADNVYKTYIDELMSPAAFVKEAGVGVAGANWFFLALYFLLALLPLSFFYPALWRSWRAGRRKAEPAAGRWLVGLAALVALLALNTATLSGRGVLAPLSALGDNVPLLLAAGGATAALALRNRDSWTVALAGAGGLALAAWLAWLRLTLLGGRGPLMAGDSPTFWAALAAGAGAAALALVLRQGGQLFRLLLATAFAYLALQALQNWTRFALVAGAVLSWNFAEWAAELPPLRVDGRFRIALACAPAAALALWAGALLSDNYFVHTGEPRHFAFREQPLEFAHDAVTFAGRPGLPDRALVYDVGQASLYTWHNAPRRKPYMDGRLEMPEESTFRTYVSVEQALLRGDPGWEPQVAAMGNPLILLEHQHHFEAEGHLLAHPGWRCVYYDALASAFVPRDTAPEFAAVDFGRRHFEAPSAPSVPAERGAAAREQNALCNLAASLPPTVPAWRGRVPILLAALDRSRLALDEDARRPETWVALGNCHWRLDPDPRVPPPSPADPWSLERSVYLAQATWCYGRAAELRPDGPAAWRYLAESYRARGMADAQAEAEDRWLTNDPKATDAQRERAAGLRARLGNAPDPQLPSSAGGLHALVVALVQHHRPAAAARLLDEAEVRGVTAWPWALADQAGVLYLHLGRPADARRAWQRGADCLAAALRECRLAATFWVERDFETALKHFQAARADDPRAAEACWGMAMLHAQLGQARAAFDACRAGHALSLGERQATDLNALEGLLAAYQDHQ